MGKIPKSKKKLIGKAIMVYAALPLFSIWAFPIGMVLALPMSPTMWAKDKIRYFKEWRNLK
jgi:hypothetical protein